MYIKFDKHELYKQDSKPMKPMAVLKRFCFGDAI